MKQEKSFDFDTNCLEEHGVFYGYASVFNVMDYQGDIIECGAFNNIDKEIVILWQHKQDEPIGKIINLSQNNNGLYVCGKLIIDIAKGNEAYTLLKSGILNGLSIGYIPKNYKIDKKTGARFISALDLIEISLVTFPANTNARVSSVKQQTHFDYNNKIEQIIQMIGLK